MSFERFIVKKRGIKISRSELLTRAQNDLALSNKKIELLEKELSLLNREMLAIKRTHVGRTVQESEEVKKLAVSTLELVAFNLPGNHGLGIRVREALLKLKG